MATSNSITQILRAFEDDPAACVEQLMPLLYDHLRRLARRELGRLRPGQTFQTTQLVNEAYLKLVGRAYGNWKDRAHFLAASAQAMRHILVDAARRRLTTKRGSGQSPGPLLSEPAASEAHAADVLEVHHALERLERLGERMVRVVECRFFAGMTEEETATALGISKRTVHRDWLRARAWLQRELDSGVGRRSEE